MNSDKWLMAYGVHYINNDARNATENHNDIYSTYEAASIEYQKLILLIDDVIDFKPKINYVILAPVYIYMLAVNGFEFSSRNFWAIARIVTKRKRAIL